MSSDADIQAACEKIKEYSPCDVSDALLTLHVPLAGHLRDITPLPTHFPPRSPRIVAPISTVLFASITNPPSNLPTPNIPPDSHWTDIAPSGSIVLLQAPPSATVALVGDIVATRYKLRGIQGIIVDGRARDVVGIGALMDGNDGSGFQCWSRGLSSVGTSLELKPWAVDVEVDVGGVRVKAGDVLVAEAAERVCCVVPRERVGEIVGVLERTGRADQGVLNDVRNGMGFKDALKRWPDHYTNQH